MKCFNHSAVEAVGFCKSCCRALCRECIVEIGLSCCCRNRCEDDVEALNALLERGRTAYQKSGALHASSGWLAVFLGTAVVLFAIYGLEKGLRRETNLFFLVLGAIFAAWGVYYIARARRFGRIDDKG